MGTGGVGLKLEAIIGFGVDWLGRHGLLVIRHSLFAGYPSSAGVAEGGERVQCSFFYSISLSYFMMKNDRKMNGMFLLSCLILAQVSGMTGEIRALFFAEIHKLFIPFPSHSCYIQQV
jgi:hypothetical protein